MPLVMEKQGNKESSCTARGSYRPSRPPAQSTTTAPRW
jgi:hypothetical protein